MDIALIAIILLLVIVLVVLRRDIKWGIYVVGTAEVLFRLCHFIGDNLGVPELNALINRVLPDSIFTVLDIYTDGIVYTILFWLLVIVFIWFLGYLIKYLIKKK